MFVGLYTGVIVASALVILLPGIPLPRVMFLSQVLNGLLLPIILVFMIVLINNERIVGRYRNTPTFNSIAWATLVAIFLLSLLLLVTTVLGPAS